MTNGDYYPPRSYHDPLIKPKASKAAFAALTRAASTQNEATSEAGNDFDWS